MQPRQPEQPRRITAADIEKRRALRRKKQRQKRLRATLLLVLAVVLIVGVTLLVRGCAGRDGGKTLPEDSSAQSGGDVSKSEDPQTTPADTEPAAPQQTRLHFLGAGDNIMHDAILADAKKRSDDGGYAFAPMYAGIASLVSDADIAFINQEGPVGAGTKYVGYPDFNAPLAVFETLQDLGFDVVNLANNHMLDQGEQGLIKTIDNAKNYTFLTIGGYTKADYDSMRILERDGVKIAFLSYTTLVNVAHKGDISSSSAYLIPYADEATIARQVTAAKEAADFVIVSMHWGEEAGWDQKSNFTENAQQQRYAKLCADLGVDVVVGHHPHVVQPVTWIEGANGGKTLVYYSLGNLICTMHYAQYLVGTLCTFDLVKNADGTTAVENPMCVPTVSHYSLNRDGLQVYRLQDYSEALAAQHGSTLKNEFTYALLQKFIKETVSAEFLPDFLH